MTEGLVTVRNERDFWFDLFLKLFFEVAVGMDLLVLFIFNSFVI